jgi:hypothetical protein
MIITAALAESNGPLNNQHDFQVVNDWARGTPWLHGLMTWYAGTGAVLFAGLLIAGKVAHGAVSATYRRAVWNAPVSGGAPDMAVASRQLIGAGSGVGGAAALAGAAASSGRSRVPASRATSRVMSGTRRK